MLRKKRLNLDYDDRVPDYKVTELKEALDNHNVVIRFKEEGYDVWWHSVLAWLANALFWVGHKLTGNDDTFMDFITTMGTFVFNVWNDKTYIYFPTRKGFSYHDLEDWCACWHELRHAIDDKDNPLWYKFSYLFVLPAWKTMRAYWEYRGYATDLAAAAELVGGADDYIVNWMKEQMVDNFTGPNYAYMHPDEDAVEKNMDRIQDGIREGTITKRNLEGMNWRRMAFGF